MEYFRIWIVNVLLVLLTIVTFGIYSAWAKVRNRATVFGLAPRQPWQP
ncbi:hypothetical protein MNJPNG_14775 [Cupriavidus oxalaticus]